FFTEDQIRESSLDQRPVIVFMRSCDIHGVRRLDQMFLGNDENDDYYYEDNSFNPNHDYSYEDNSFNRNKDYSFDANSLNKKEKKELLYMTPIQKAKNRKKRNGK
ncbi:MAG: hypothetical protein VZR10_10860, partial [Methanobrevibacter sp.]|nr:hypothetical protein [Methanobrevibacter sp.]